MLKKCKCNSFPTNMLGILFLGFGIMKLFLMTPTGFAENMIMPVFGVGMELALVLAWLVIIFELVGGVAILCHRHFSKRIYQVLLFGLIVILAGAILFVHLPGKDFGSILKDLLIVSLLISMFCPCKKGIHCGHSGCQNGKCAVREAPQE